MSRCGILEKETDYLGSDNDRCASVLSCFRRVWLFVTPWTVAHQASLSMGFSRQEHQRGLPFPSPGYIPDLGIKPKSPALEIHIYCLTQHGASQVALVIKNPPANAGDAGLIPGSGRCPGRGNGTSLQYSCLENAMDREAWWATVHGIAKSWTQLSD